MPLAVSTSKLYVRYSLLCCNSVTYWLPVLARLTGRLGSAGFLVRIYQEKPIRDRAEHFISSPFKIFNIWTHLKSTQNKKTEDLLVLYSYFKFIIEPFVAHCTLTCMKVVLIAWMSFGILWQLQLVFPWHSYTGYDKSCYSHQLPEHWIFRVLLYIHSFYFAEDYKTLVL